MSFKYLSMHQFIFVQNYLILVTTGNHFTQTKTSVVIKQSDKEIKIYVCRDHLWYDSFEEALSSSVIAITYICAGSRDRCKKCYI